MADQDVLAVQFEQNRSHLQAVAMRMLGSSGEADDAVQEAWLRRAATAPTASTTSADGSPRSCRGSASTCCVPGDRSGRTWATTPAAGPRGADPHRSVVAVDPEAQALLADSLGPALLVVLDQLSPAERIAFVLHDTFDVPFDEIGPILGRTPAATRQLASRARRRIRGGAAPDADPGRQQEVVQAFLAAARGGEFERLIELLAPEVVLRADDAAARTGAPSELSGAQAVAGMFSGRALAAQAAVIDGSAGLVWATGGTPRVVFEFTVEDGRVRSIDMGADEVLLTGAEVRLLDD